MIYILLMQDTNFFKVGYTAEFSAARFGVARSGVAMRGRVIILLVSFF